MQLGVKTGMVRSRFNCISGIDAFKQEFKKISSENDPNDVLNEWFVQHYLKAEFSKNLSSEDRGAWMKKYGKSFKQSVNDTLIEGMKFLKTGTSFHFHISFVTEVLGKRKVSKPIL